MEITLNRNRLQEVHEVFRLLADYRSSSPLSDRLLVRSEPGRIMLVGTNGNVDVFYEAAAPKNQDAAQVLVPISSLADLAKGEDGPVQLAGKAATQTDIEQYPVIGADGPKRFRHADWPVLHRHLRNAGEVAASAPDRYAINNICLTQSSIVATDGRQLYAGNNLSLPIRKRQDRLAAPAKVLASKTLANFTQVAMASDHAGILFKLGDAWTVRLRRQEGRFPDWQKVVPGLKEAKATLTLPAGKSGEFIERIGGLVNGNGKDISLRLALGPKIIATALDEDSKELRSLELLDLTRTGEDLVAIFDPKYLLHALKMGLLTFHFFTPGKPIIATQGSDLYLWMPCIEENAAPAGSEQPAPIQDEKPPTHKRRTRTAKPASQQSGLDALLSDLDSIKDGLRDLLAKVSAAKQSARQRTAELQKREKAVRAALASLKQLKNLGA
jgi:DNA polymerase III sliding clamp (beta) subunit (PCNA family)